MRIPFLGFLSFICLCVSVPADSEATDKPVPARTLRCRFSPDTAALYRTEGTLTVERQLGDEVAVAGSALRSDMSLWCLEEGSRFAGALVGCLDASVLTPEEGAPLSHTAARAWRVAPDGSLTERREPRRKLHPGARRVYGQLFPENLYYIPLPAGSVIPGDSWEGTALLPLPGVSIPGKAVVRLVSMQGDIASLYGVITPLAGSEDALTATIEAEFDCAEGRMLSESLSVTARHDAGTARISMTVALTRRFAGLLDFPASERDGIAGRIRVVKSALDALIAARTDTAETLLKARLDTESEEAWRTGWKELRTRTREIAVYALLPDMQPRPAWVRPQAVSSETGDVAVTAALSGDTGVTARIIPTDTTPTEGENPPPTEISNDTAVTSGAENTENTENAEKTEKADSTDGVDDAENGDDTDDARDDDTPAPGDTASTAATARTEEKPNTTATQRRAPVRLRFKHR